MHITWNQQLVKKENKSLCLYLIKNNAPISRADIAQQTGLTKGTVSSLVSELIDEQLIYKSGHVVLCLQAGFPVLIGYSKFTATPSNIFASSPWA